MSADNGIYILKTPAVPIKEGNVYVNQHDQFEYRVAHCQAIDNIDYSDLFLPLYFGNSKVVCTEGEAWNIAKQLYQHVGWTEYGVSLIEKQRHFPNMTAKAAQKALDCYVGAQPLDYKE